MVGRAGVSRYCRCPLGPKADRYRRDLARRYAENCAVCRDAGIDRRATHFTEEGNMCDGHYGTPAVLDVP